MVLLCDPSVMTADRIADPPRADATTERAERILSAAYDLLLSWGYKRVTIDDVARHARVGKGTVYLHWKTKEQLFTSLLRRECAAMLEDVVSDIRTDPARTMPHSLLRLLFVGQLRHPLTRAVHAGDSEVLGALAVAPTGQPVTEVLGVHTTLGELVGTLRRHGLVIDDGPEQDQVYAIDAIMSGFFLRADTVAQECAPSPRRQADLLATTIRAAFEPVPPPGSAAVRAAASEVIDDLLRARDRLTDEPVPYPRPAHRPTAGLQTR
jgi:AcrR family transcriptional regulator